MIKRLIFDLDNTLILWKDHYVEAIRKTIDYFNIETDYRLLDSLIESYEQYYNVYKKEYLLELINKKCNLNLGIEFIDRWLYELGFMAEYNKELDDTLNYLSSKYELVLLTNMFKESQVRRLKTAGVYEYFTEVYGGDKYIKPNKESYYQAMGKYDIDECIMIGDTFKTDITGALVLGMRVIQVDLKNEINTELDYPVIKKISELKEML